MTVGTLGMATVLAACSSSAGGSTDSAAQVSATYSGSAVVDLSFWSWTLNAQAVVDEFNKTHPNIHVTFTKITGGPAGYSKLFDAFKAGNAPDVFNCEYDMLPEFASEGLVQDISAYVTPQLKSALGAALPLTTLGGKTWAIPYDIEPTELWYRADLFQKYDLAVPTTWDQFASEAKALAAKDPGAKLAALPTDDALWLASLAEQAGGQWFSSSGGTWKVDLTGAADEKVASYWQGLADDKLLYTGASSSPAYTTAFTNGQILSMIEPAYEGAYLKSSYPKQAGDWAVAPLPNWGSAADGAEGGSSYPVSKDTKNTAAALEFAEWMATSSDAISTRMQGGASSALPADSAAAAQAESSFDKSYYAQSQDIFSVANAAAATVSQSWAWGPQVPGMDTAMSTPMGQIGSGGTVAAVLSTGQSQVLQLLKSAGLQASAG
ncbi:extracellular solute-binding protein [Actinospica durhamensis]|uniref:Extracellular solute-binding protein n=2 Tax=Actinospica durhamensis TaxID=1508375 RepID=A0A941IVD2_9ACTN|nr:extracellular solute-binding protein [Actinospica durhamensis]